MTDSNNTIHKTLLKAYEEIQSREAQLDKLKLQQKNLNEELHVYKSFGLFEDLQYTYSL